MSSLISAPWIVAAGDCSSRGEPDPAAEADVGDDLPVGDLQRRDRGVDRLEVALVDPPRDDLAGQPARMAELLREPALERCAEVHARDSTSARRDRG